MKWSIFFNCGDHRCGVSARPLPSLHLRKVDWETCHWWMGWVLTWTEAAKDKWVNRHFTGQNSATMHVCRQPTWSTCQVCVPSSLPVHVTCIRSYLWILARWAKTPLTDCVVCDSVCQGSYGGHFSLDYSYLWSVQTGITSTQVVGLAIRKSMG